MKASDLSLAWESPHVARGYRTGVSLHSHTSYSLETLAVVSTYSDKNRALWRAVRAIDRRFVRLEDGGVDFSRLYFVPPLGPVEADEVERAQIEHDLGLEAMVSITDHDTIASCELLARSRPGRETPRSVEWTVPFDETYLHLGIHNIAPDVAPEIADRMRRLSAGCAVCRDAATVCFGAHKSCGAQQTAGPVRDLLARVAEDPRSLVVLHHPAWDMNGLGASGQNRAVERFFAEAGEFVHAVEVNGLRSWEENRAAISLAESIGLPVVSGGDRHGCEPAAMLNLTGAGSFAEFVAELRVDRRSHVLVMPQYREPVSYRKLQATWDVLRDYPAHPDGSRHWFDRVLYRTQDGALRSLGERWGESRGPAVLTASMFLMKSLERWPMRNALRFAFAREALAGG